MSFVLTALLLISPFVLAGDQGGGAGGKCKSEYAQKMDLLIEGLKRHPSILPQGVTPAKIQHIWDSIPTVKPLADFKQGCHGESEAIACSYHDKRNKFDNYFVGGFTELLCSPNHKKKYGYLDLNSQERLQWPLHEIFTWFDKKTVNDQTMRISNRIVTELLRREPHLLTQQSASSQSGPTPDEEIIYPTIKTIKPVSLTDVFFIATECYREYELRGLGSFLHPNASFQQTHNIGHECVSSQRYRGTSQDVTIEFSEESFNSCGVGHKASIDIRVSGPDYSYMMAAQRNRNGQIVCRYKKTQPDRSQKNAVERFLLENPEIVEKEMDGLRFYENELSCDKVEHLRNTVTSSCSGFTDLEGPNSTIQFSFIIEVDLQRKKIKTIGWKQFEIEDDY